MRFDMPTGRLVKSGARSMWRCGAWLPLLLALPFSASAAEHKPAAGKAPEKCMAGICLETPMTQKNIVAKYGPGRNYVPTGVYAGESTGWKNVRRPDPDVSQRCYYDPTQRLYIEFGFDKHQQRQSVYNSDLVEIVVSTVPMCAKTYTPKRPFPPFKTEHGVGIGATEAEVQAAVGKPDNTISIADRERLRSSRGESRESLMRDHMVADFGEMGLNYNPDPKHKLLQNLFYISHGKVKSILLSDSE